MQGLWWLLVLCVVPGWVQGVDLWGYWKPPNYQDSSGNLNNPTSVGCSQGSDDRGSYCTSGGFKVALPSGVRGDWYLSVWVRLGSVKEDLIEVEDTAFAVCALSLSSSSASVCGSSQSSLTSATSGIKDKLEWTLLALRYEKYLKIMNLDVNGKFVKQQSWGSGEAKSIEIKKYSTMKLGEVKLLTKYMGTSSCSGIPVDIYCPKPTCGSASSLMVHSLQEYFTATVLMHAGSSSTIKLAYDPDTGKWEDGSTYQVPEVSGTGSDYCMETTRYEAKRCTTITSPYLCAN
eukprot:Sspe_Gene.113113::Locus_97022_Transcript_1_1_Confidence_1.000_Length_905::g.113113::m.113113